MQSNNNTIHLKTPSRSERFVPTCPICGNKHWPKDPSCLGKKGAKAKAKAKVAAKGKTIAERLGPVNTNTYEAPRVEAKPVSQPFPPQVTNYTPTPAPTQSTIQHGGEQVINIKAESEKQALSFVQEVERIKKQADQVVAAASADAARQIEAERQARQIAEEDAKEQTQARIKAEQKLKQSLLELENLKHEARIADQLYNLKME